MITTEKYLHLALGTLRDKRGSILGRGNGEDFERFLKLFFGEMETFDLYSRAVRDMNLKLKSACVVMDGVSYDRDGLEIKFTDIEGESLKLSLPFSNKQTYIHPSKDILYFSSQRGTFSREENLLLRRTADTLSGM